MSDKSEASKLRRSIDRLRSVRSRPVSHKKQIAAAALAGAVAVLTFYLLVLAIPGRIELPWEFSILVAIGGATTGTYIGVKSAPSGVVAGVLGGIWILIEIILAIIGVIFACLTSAFG